MKINRNNYESFFLDYIEGNLSSKEIAELKVFISENVDLENELKEFETINITPEKSSFEEKERLKISSNENIEITLKNIDEFCVAHYENDLTLEKEKELARFFKTHPEKELDFALFSKTNLNPDQAIKFSESNSLLRSVEKENVTDENFKEFCIAYYEKLLSAEGEQKLVNFMNSNTEKKSEFDAYKNVILFPDTNTIFKDKSTLKKNRIIQLVPAKALKYVFAAAAILVLFFALFYPESIIHNSIKNTAQTIKVKPLPPEQKSWKYAQITNEDKKNKLLNKKNVSKPVKNKSSKQDSTKNKQTKLKYLKPFTIENYHNARFSLMQKPQNIIENVVKIANVEFNFEKIPESVVPEKNDKYLSISEYLAERAKKIILKDKYTKNKKINYLDVAQAGINGIDKILPGKIEFDHKENKSGEIKYLAINTPLFGYSKEFNR